MTRVIIILYICVEMQIGNNFEEKLIRYAINLLSVNAHKGLK